MAARVGTILNLGRVSKYMQMRGWLGLVWGLMAHDAKNSSNRRMAVLLLRGEPRREYQFGIDWYCKTRIGYQSADGNCVPIQFVRMTSESGLFWAPNLVSKFYGTTRETLANYLPTYDFTLSRIRVLPNRMPDDRGLSPVFPREVASTGKLPQVHSLNGLCFNDDAELDQYLRENVRFFSRIRGVARLNNGVRKLNHWKIGPIRA